MFKIEKTQVQHGRWKEGAGGRFREFGNLIFSYEIVRKKGCFPSFGWAKMKFNYISPLDNSFWLSMEKIVPTAMGCRQA